MPRSARSLQLTSSYRARLAAIRQRAEASARAAWPTIDTLDGTRWAERTAQTLAGAQTQAIRAGAGYMTAFISSELGRRVPVVTIDTRRYTGLARDGRPLTESLQSPLIAVRAALKQGRAPHDALRIGLHRGVRMVETDLMHAARSSLLDAIESDDRIDGWQRATSGTCGACMALSGTTAPRFEVHPGCQCQPQPVVKGVPDRVPLLTGVELFRRMSKDEQDAQFGPDKAAALRADEIALDDLVSVSPIATAQDFLTERPLEAAKQDT